MPRTELKPDRRRATADREMAFVFACCKTPDGRLATSRYLSLNARSRALAFSCDGAFVSPYELLLLHA